MVGPLDDATTRSVAHNGFAANITIPARRLDGVVVQPGQQFDFWSALGEVSFRTGYRLGGAIVGGHSVEGKALAGGICAASTTLFNAAARGGLEIVTRQPHWYYITRYPLGLDATVSQSQTMRFRNDTKLPDPHRAYRLTGHRPLRDLERAQRPDRVVEPAQRHERRPRLRLGPDDLDPGEGQDANASNGRSTARMSSVTRTVRDANGASSTRQFVSHYHRMVGITLVGSLTGTASALPIAPLARR